MLVVCMGCATLLITTGRTGPMFDGLAQARSFSLPKTVDVLIYAISLLE